MSKKIAPIDTIIMTFVGRPSEDSIRKFVKQILKIDSMIIEEEKKSKVVK